MNDRLMTKHCHPSPLTEADTPTDGRVSSSSRFPPWLRKRLPAAGKKKFVERVIADTALHTVCDEAKCPNRSECFSQGIATFLIMGAVCTRDCLFCNVAHGLPGPLDPQEPERLARAIKMLDLRYVVVTMVTRDDCEDGGAAHIAQTITYCKRTCSNIKIEVLVSDFKGVLSSCVTVCAGRPDVFSHNIETVPSLFRTIRPGADYARSLRVLRTAAEFDAPIPVKSGFMVGLGETENEVIEMMHDLRNAGVSLLTIGQYLRPSARQAPVVEFITPEQFDRYGRLGRELGFADVIAGPFVRSSYHAEQLYNTVIAIQPHGL